MTRRLISSLDKLMRHLRRLVRGLPSQELRQAVMRLVIGAPLLSLVLYLSYRQQPDMTPRLFWSTSGLLFLSSLALLTAVLMGPVRSIARRYLGVMIDTGAITGVLLLGGATASPVWLAYLWVVADHARRYGSQGLAFTISLSLGGFSLVLVANEYWMGNSHLGLSLLVLLAALSTYLSSRLAGINNKCIPPRRDASPACDEDLDFIHPLASQPQDDPEERSDTQRQRALKGKKILLLSNDRGEQQTIRRHLDSWGAATTICTNVARCFTALITASEQETPFHALIAIHGRFEMDCRQLADCIRSDPALLQLEMIHIGTTPEGALSDQLREAGFSKLLGKPLDKTLLFDALHGIDGNPLGKIPRVVRLLDHYTLKKSRQPLSILLADINPNDLRRNKRILQQAGHQVFVVDNGLRILDALESHSFDIAVVSMQLPEVDGLEAFKLYRFTRADQAWMPFVILLDQVTTAKVSECEDAGVNAVLAKPVVSNQLTEVVEDAVQASLQDKMGKSNSGLDRGTKLTRAILIDGLTLDGQRLKELEQLGQGQQFLANLIDNFNKDSNQMLRMMEQAVESLDLPRFHDLGHTIKDSAGNLGILELYQLGVRATRLHIADFPGNAQRLVGELRQCCNDSHRALQNYLSSRKKFFTQN